MGFFRRIQMTFYVARAMWRRTAKLKGNANIQLIVEPFGDDDDELLLDGMLDEMSLVRARWMDKRKERRAQRAALKEASNGAGAVD